MNVVIESVIVVIEVIVTIVVVVVFGRHHCTESIGFAQRGAHCWL